MKSFQANKAIRYRLKVPMQQVKIRVIFPFKRLLKCWVRQLQPLQEYILIHLTKMRYIRLTVFYLDAY
jgi:hypothetical protein